MKFKDFGLLYWIVSPSGGSPVEALVKEVIRFPGAYETEGDMVGERSFRVGRREFLHVHGRVLHLILPKAEKEGALSSGRAEQHPIVPRSGYVQVRISSESDLEGALALAKRAYDHAASKQEAASPSGG